PAYTPRRPRPKSVQTCPAAAFGRHGSGDHARRVAEGAHPEHMRLSAWPRETTSESGRRTEETDGKPGPRFREIGRRPGVGCAVVEASRRSEACRAAHASAMEPLTARRRGHVACFTAREEDI